MRLKNDYFNGLYLRSFYVYILHPECVFVKLFSDNLLFLYLFFVFFFLSNLLFVFSRIPAIVSDKPTPLLWDTGSPYAARASQLHLILPLHHDDIQAEESSHL